MKKLTFGVATAALALAAPFAARAQQLPPAVVAVVDTDRVIRECTVCVTANTQLQQQVQQLQARAQQLSAPLNTERAAIQSAIQALPQGTQPDAALQTRIRNFETNSQNAQQEISAQQQTIERNRNYVLQQIGQRIQPAVQQVMTQRGANLAVDVNAALGSAPTLDITAAVLAAVNQNTAPLNVTAPPPQQQPAAQTPARTPAPTTPQRPRPQGR
jgi:Skp family chaperone for outer membrane proteins